MIQLTGSWWRFALRWSLRIAVILAVAYAVHLALVWLNSQIDELPTSTQKLMVTSLLVGVLVAYGFLIAVPFVPGIEIGLSLLLISGPSVAPLVYAATVCGLSLAFWVGRSVPPHWIQRVLLDLRLNRLAAFLDQVDGKSAQARLDLMQERLPVWLGRLCSRWRYLVLAALINLPGNVVIGGGGGILLLAGMTRIYQPVGTLITLLLAVMPVPLAVWVFGVDIYAR